MGAKKDETGNFAYRWEAEYKPQILQYKRVPLELAAEILGYGTIAPIQAMLRSKMYSFGCARPGKDGDNIYEIYPFRLIKWVEGSMQ